MKKVVTLDNKGFSDACRRLGAQVVASGFRPRIVVGIRTGGEYVALEIAGLFAERPMVVTVDMQRPTTPSKQRLRGLIRSLPRFVANLLRILESALLSRRKPAPRQLLTLPESLRDVSDRQILVCDDAVDSGTTLEAVVASLRRANPAAEIRSAVLTVTTASPTIRPDYSLFTDLLRFPWSMDA